MYLEVKRARSIVKCLKPMSVKMENLASADSKTAEHRLRTKFIVVGREGSIALGNLLATLLRLRRRSIVETVSFDHSRGLTLYEIELRRSQSPRKVGSVDLMVCLNDPGLDYESYVREFGTLLVDANSVTRSPKRSDIDIIEVPAFSLVQDMSERLTHETKSRIDLAVASLLGIIEAVEGTYPDEDLLMQLLEKAQVEPAVPFFIGVYRGYDWLQETRLRAKNPFRRVGN